MLAPMGERFCFGTKAETLERLSRLVRSATVLPLEQRTVEQWKRDREDVLEQVLSRSWGKSELVVRSSARSEDEQSGSNAGRFTTVLGISGRAPLRRAIETVVASFGHARPDDQFLVQPLLVDVVASGVGSSHEPSSGAPYRVVNWADGEDTTVVTAGKPGIRTWYYLPGGDPEPPVDLLAGIPRAMDELAELVGDDPFEFEFGVRSDLSIVLFQARRLVTVTGGCGITAARHRTAVSHCAARVRALQRRHPPALGADTLLGVMPDWNPAEMLGARPKPLSVSLYRSLITDQVWAQARRRYGYRDLSGIPLLTELHGLPYIDVRASFSSLVPAALGETAAARLVASYLARLRSQPHLHDKVEFAIVLSSFYFGIARRLGALIADGVLSGKETREFELALRRVTTGMMAGSGPVRHDLRGIRSLAQSDLAAVGRELGYVERTALLLRMCRTQGALPFAGLARAAFVATSLVHSMTEAGVWTAAEADGLLGASNTVTETLRRDFATGDRELFLRRYGHLRPGAYDISSRRYDDSPHRYFEWTGTPAVPPGAPQFRPAPRHLRQIQQLLSEHRFPESPEGLLTFVRTSVAAREHAKLHYSRAVSELLTEIARAGERLGFGVDDMAYTTVGTLTALTGDRGHDREVTAEAVARGKERYAVTQSLLAPALLDDPDNLRSFVALEAEPTFITRSRVVAPVADVDSGDRLDGAIAMISAADPGYDWIFTHRITGLVTAFGGANSHMALRALELGLPAAIGVGEGRFRQWLSAGRIEIDASNRVVQPAGFNHVSSAPAANGGVA